MWYTGHNKKSHNFMPRSQTITCKNCGVKVTITKGTRKKRTGPKNINNVRRGKLLAKFSKENRERTGSPGPFSAAQKAQLKAVPRGKKRTKKAPTGGFKRRAREAPTALPALGPRFPDRF